MALKEIAVDGMTVEQQDTITPPGETVTCVIVIKPPTITTVRGEGNLAHVHGDQITVSAISTNIATIADPGPYDADLEATTTKTKAEGVLVLRVDDETAVINATPQIPGSPPTNHPITFKCKITDAGQTKVKAQ